MNLNRHALGSAKLPPLKQRNRPIDLEHGATVEMAIQIEVVVDRSMDSSKLLQRSKTSKPLHRVLSSSQWQM